MTIRRLAFTAIGVVAIAPSAFAACTNPDGVRGALAYNDTYSVLQICDGNNWSMVGSGPNTLAALTDVDSGAAANGYVLTYNSTTSKWEAVAPGAGGITTLTGDVTASGSGSVVATIAANAVTSAKILDGTIANADIANGTIANAKLANMAANTVKGNNTGSAAAPVDLTMTQLRAMIGTGTPGASNFLRGDGSWQAVSSGAVTGTGAANHIAYWDSASGLTYDNNQLYWDETDNRLGIGTTAPNSKLHVYSSSDNRVIVDSSDTTANTYTGYDIRDAGVFRGGLFVENSDKSKLNLWSANGKALTIDSATNNVGIGTTNPSATLDVKGDAGIRTFDSTATTTLKLYTQSASNRAVIQTNAGKDLALLVNDGSTEAMRVSNAGNVGIGTTSPQSLLQVAGGVQLANDAAACPGASNVKLGTLKYASNTLSVCNTGGWAALSTGGGATAAGTTGQIQFNDGSNAFAADASLTWDNSTKKLVASWTQTSRFNVTSASPVWDAITVNVSGGLLGLYVAATGTSSGIAATSPVTGISGTSSGTSGYGVYGVATATSGTTYGMYGSAASPSGTGVLGTSTATGGGQGVKGTAVGSGSTGVFGSTSNDSGARGVYGEATATTGSNSFGVYGTSAGTGGRAVYGHATSGTGSTYGVYGMSNSTSGYGVYGYALASSGTTYGVYGSSASTGGRGVFGTATAASGSAYGVRGESASTTGYGVYGVTSALTGASIGVSGESPSTSGRGVYGFATAATGTTYGVRGDAFSSTGVGVLGWATGTSGANYGVWGQTDSTGGRAVFGNAGASSGTTYGGYFNVVSPSGYAVYASGRTHVQGNLTASGSVGIATTAPAYPLDVNGSIRATTYLYTSDRRLKSNIATVDGLDLVSRLRGVSFNWKQSGKSATGVIAQEVEKVMPAAISTDAAGLKSVDYPQLIGPLIEAVKTLKSQNDLLREQLKAANNSHAADISALRVELDMLKARDVDRRHAEDEGFPFFGWINATSENAYEPSSDEVH